MAREVFMFSGETIGGCWLRKLLPGGGWRGGTKSIFSPITGCYWIVIMAG